MVTYTLDQAQRDVANIRGQIAHLQASAEFLQMTIDTKLTLPDSTTWTSSGISPSLLLTDQASAPSAVSGSGTVYADASGFLRYLPDSASSDSDTYTLSKVYKATNTTVTNSSPHVTGLAANLAAGSYTLDGWLLFQSTSTSAVAIGWDGTATTSAFESIVRYSGPTGASAATTVVSNQGTFGTVANQSMTLSSSASPLYEITMHGIATVSSAGTLTVKVNGGSATTGTILAASHIKVTRI